MKSRIIAIAVENFNEQPCIVSVKRGHNNLLSIPVSGSHLQYFRKKGLFGWSKGKTPEVIPGYALWNGTHCYLVDLESDPIWTDAPSNVTVTFQRTNE